MDRITRVSVNGSFRYSRDKAVLITGASVSGWVATPGVSPYCMSKFALRALANAIAPELRRAGVKVTLVSPGTVVSNFRRVDNHGTRHEGTVDSVPAWIQMSTEKAAQEILVAVARGKREEIITLHGRIFVALEKFMPWVNRALGRRKAARFRETETDPRFPSVTQSVPSDL